MKSKKAAAKKWQKIERIYASHGFVIVQQKDGTESSWDVATAATVGHTLLASAPEEEPDMSDSLKRDIRLENKYRQSLADAFVAACKEAKFQLECPKNAEDAAVAKMYKESLNEIKRPLDPEIKQQIDDAVLLYPTISKDELRAVFETAKRDGMSKSLIIEMLYQEHEARVKKWQDEKKVDAPSLLTFGAKGRNPGQLAI